MNEVKLAETALLTQIPPIWGRRMPLWHKNYFLRRAHSPFSCKKIWNIAVDLFWPVRTAIAGRFPFQI